MRRFILYTYIIIVNNTILYVGTGLCTQSSARIYINFLLSRPPHQHRDHYNNGYWSCSGRHTMIQRIPIPIIPAKTGAADQVTDRRRRQRAPRRAIHNDTT